MTLTELNNEHSKRTSQILEDNEIFFAFNEKQFNEGKEKHNISVDNKCTDIGGGGFMPVKNIDQMEQDMEALDKWSTEAEKTLDDKIRLKRISYELYDDMLCVLPPAYWNGSTFQVGEAYDHVVLGGKEYARYATYTKKGDRYYSMGILTTQQVRDYIIAN